jgi:hypothetical protein
MPQQIRAGVAMALVIAPLALLAAACSRPQEQQYLNQFFRAARARDNSTLAMMSAVEFDTEERRTPLDFQSLIDAERKAVTEQADFLKRKIEYQNANLPALEAIVKMERDPTAKFTPAQQKMKAEWDKWRADTTMHQKAVAAAKSAMTSSTGPAEASLTQPGQPPFSAEKFQGNLVSKDVTLNAQVRTPDGQTSNKTLVVTIQRVEGTLDGAQRTGRPIITNIQGA